MVARIAIERWLLDRLLPYAANARTHSDEQVAQIAELVDDRSVLMAGHGRVLARQLGLAEVLVVPSRT
jgi:hypothetical protein